MDIFGVVTVLCFDKGNNTAFFQPRNNDVSPLSWDILVGSLKRLIWKRIARCFQYLQDSR